MHALTEALSYAFVQRAVLVGLMVSVSAALLGVVLVLKHYSLIGHGLSEVGFASLTIALVLGLPPLLFSGPVVVLAAVVIMFVSQRYGAQGDVAIGVGSTGALALGVIVAAAGPGINVDVQNYIFGSILSVTREDVWLAFAVFLLVAGVFPLFHNRLFLVFYDENFARSAGVKVSFYQFLISLLTALTVVVGMRMVGTLLISGLIIFPAVTARRLAWSYASMVVLAAVVGVIGCVVGMGLSLATDWPAGASIVAVNIMLCVLAFLKRRG